MSIIERKKELVGNIGSFEKSSIRKIGGKIQCLIEANPREMTFGSKNLEFRIIDCSKNRDSTVHKTDSSISDFVLKSMNVMAATNQLDLFRKFLCTCQSIHI